MLYQQQGKPDRRRLVPASQPHALDVLSKLEQKPTHVRDDYNGDFRGGYRTAAKSKVELFVIIVNSWKPLTIITKSSTLDVAAVLDPALMRRAATKNFNFRRCCAIKEGMLKPTGMSKAYCVSKAYRGFPKHLVTRLYVKKTPVKKLNVQLSSTTLESVSSKQLEFQFLFHYRNILSSINVKYLQP